MDGGAAIIVFAALLIGAMLGFTIGVLWERPKQPSKYASSDDLMNLTERVEEFEAELDRWRTSRRPKGSSVDVAPMSTHPTRRRGGATMCS